MSRIRTVADLIEELNRYPEDAKVLIGVQPSYPLVHRVAGIAVEGSCKNGYDCSDASVCLDEEYPCDCTCHTGESVDESVVYVLAEEGHPHDRSPYASKSLWDEV